MKELGNENLPNRITVAYGPIDIKHAWVEQGTEEFNITNDESPFLKKERAKFELELLFGRRKLINAPTNYEGLIH